ncbi:MAG: hypothetical protein ACRD20_19550 [Terriglobales bacterium]
MAIPFESTGPENPRHPHHRWSGVNTTSQRPPIVRNDANVEETNVNPTRSDIVAASARESQLLLDHQQRAAADAAAAAAASVTPANLAETLGQHGVPVAAARALGNYIAYLEGRIKYDEGRLTILEQWREHVDQPHMAAVERRKK